MGIGSSSRFKRDAEFLIGCPSREARLQKLITKEASKIITTTSSFNILVSLARAGDCSALLCALDVTRQALTAPSSAAQRDLAKKLRAIFGSKARTSHAAQCIFTFTAGNYSRVKFGRLVVPRIDGTMPFLAAAEAGHWHVILWMAAEGVNVLTHDERTGFGVLHAAARGGQAALLQHLLAWDIEVLDNDGASPLHSSSHLTLDGRAVYKWVDFPGMGCVTPLMVAAYFGQGECVRVLLQAGADITLSLAGGAAVPLPSGSTALHCAARGRSCQGAVELLKALYTAAGGPMVDNAANSTMRLHWEGDPAVDLRAQPNNLGVLPTSYASISAGSVALERILHPRLPVALVIRQEDPSWSGFDGGVPRLYVLALDALRKYHLSTLEELEHATPAASSPPMATAAACSSAAPRRLPSAEPDATGGGAEDTTVRGGSAAAAALAGAAGQAPPVMVQFASASRDDLLAMHPSNRSMSTQSLRELSFIEARALGGDGAEDLPRVGRAAASRSVMQRGPALAEAATVVSGSAGTLTSMWTELTAAGAGEQMARQLSLDRARSSHMLPRRSRSPFQLEPHSPGPPGAGFSTTAPLRAQGRAAGSGVGAGAGSSSTWHGGAAFEEGGAAHGHFRFFSTPGGQSDAAPSTSAAMAATPSGHLPGDFLSDTLDGVETESEMELQWALYSAQMESTRHSVKGAGGGGSVIATASVSDAEADAAPPEVEAVPLLSRMIASVDRAAGRVPHIFAPAPLFSSLRGGRRAGGDNSSTHSSRSSVGLLERSGRQRSLVSTLGSVDHERRCPICMDGPTFVRVSGCKHGMCVACARTLCTSVSRAPACPLCRMTVATFERVDVAVPTLG